MKWCSAWLVIELDNRGHPRIARVRKSRPLNEMAIHITLGIDPNDLQPHVEALVAAGAIQVEIEEPDQAESEVVANSVTE